MNLKQITDYKRNLKNNEKSFVFKARTNDTNYYIVKIDTELQVELKLPIGEAYILSNKRHYNDAEKGLEYILRELIKAGYYIQSVNIHDFCLLITKCH